MSEKPIKGVLDGLFDNMKSLLDANTVIGDPITTPDGVTILPVSKISVGFGSAGGEKEKLPVEGKVTDNLFHGGAGGGVMVYPLGFLVTNNGNVRFIPITNQMTSVDRIIDAVPDVVDKINGFVQDYQKRKHPPVTPEEDASGV